MPDEATSASLIGLPTELLRIIIPDPAKLHKIKVSHNYIQHQQWLPIKSDASAVEDLGKGRAQTLRTLRVLTQTSTRLRAIALPLLWSVVHIETIQELALLRDVLNSAPWLASYVKHFSFLWSMGTEESELFKYDKWPRANGTLLDLAFVDREAAWQELRKQCGCSVRLEALGCDHSHLDWCECDDKYLTASFKHDGFTFLRPGCRAGSGMTAAEASKAEEIGPRRYHFNKAGRKVLADNVETSGPDCKGKDGRIKNAQDFNDCVTDIVEQLSGIQTFRWCSQVCSVPSASVKALAKAASLKTLFLRFGSPREVVHAAPFWELASTLEHLAIDGIAADPERITVIREYAEEEITSFEPPTAAIYNSAEAKSALHIAVAHRTLVAAIQGGNLKQLTLSYARLERDAPFGVRALLPYWLSIERWRFHDDATCGAWLEAAVRFRSTLAHASAWLHPVTPGEPRGRRLTQQDMQSLSAYFAQAQMQFDLVTHGLIGERRTTRHPVKHYFTWMKQDVQLARRVADAWNDIVERGEADVVECECAKCSPDSRFRW